MKNKTLRFVLLFVFWLIASGAFALEAPYLTGRVTDHAQILSDDIRKSVTAVLKAHEDKTGNQIAVLTVSSLEGVSVEEYANTVFNAWKLGQKGKDNGILVLVAPKDRRMRIEVGYGLEGVVTDAVAGSIIRNVMTPYFKTGDYNAGIRQGVGAIVAVLEGGKVPETPAAVGETPEKTQGFLDAPEMAIKERILLGAFIFGIIGLFTVMGILTPGVGWFLYFFLIPFWAMFPIVIVGSTGALYMLVIYLIVFPVIKLFLRKTDWYAKAAKDLKTKGRANIGGFMLTSGGSGGGWSSGSGFSGGGGSSGGGGASGSW